MHHTPDSLHIAWDFIEQWCRELVALLTYLWRERATPLMVGQLWLILAGCCMLVVVLLCCVVARAILGKADFSALRTQQISPNHPNEIGCCKSLVLQHPLLFRLKSSIGCILNVKKLGWNQLGRVSSFLSEKCIVIFTV
jgi:hypothetical protein